MRTLLTGLFLLLLASTGTTAQVQRWTANDGQLVMEDIPPIPESLPPILSRYQNIRSAGFASWSKDSKSIFYQDPPGARHTVASG